MSMNVRMCSPRIQKCWKCVSLSGNGRFIRDASTALPKQNQEYAEQSTLLFWPHSAISACKLSPIFFCASCCFCQIVECRTQFYQRLTVLWMPDPPQYTHTHTLSRERQWEREGGREGRGRDNVDGSKRKKESRVLLKMSHFKLERHPRFWVAHLATSLHVVLRKWVLEILVPSLSFHDSDWFPAMTRRTQNHKRELLLLSTNDVFKW